MSYWSGRQISAHPGGLESLPPGNRAVVYVFYDHKSKNSSLGPTNS
jgi:hypothetical protein